MSTALGLHTRKYHGWLIASLQPPARRYLLVSGVEEVYIRGDERWDLSVHHYPGVLHPRGDRHLESFDVAPGPRWTYYVGTGRVERALLRVHGTPTLLVRYRAWGGAVEARPRLAYRELHHLTRRNPELDPRVSPVDGGWRVQPYPGLPALHMAASAGRWSPGPLWFHNVEYPEEARRGYPHREDLWSPGVFSLDLSSGESMLGFSTHPLSPRELPRLWRDEEERRLVPAGGDPLLALLHRAAHQFLVSRVPQESGDFRRPPGPAGAGGVSTKSTRSRKVSRGDTPTVIAGYPWFGDWGRDTLISLPGLTLATGHPGVARALLEAFARRIHGGLVPNTFREDSGEPLYNSVDAGLWFIHALGLTLDAERDTGFAVRMFPAVEEILSRYTRGTLWGIRARPDGLLEWHHPGAAITWMDAIDGVPVSPRQGSPVEVNSLWLHALHTGADIAQGLGEKRRATEWREQAARAAGAFPRVFWNPARQCLYDVVDGDRGDPRVRPNQILAVSLPRSPLTPEQQRAVVERVTGELLTPVGLRSLSPREPGYRGRYEGDTRSRDTAYHQGTVWPWLIGPYTDARLRLGAIPAECRSLLQPLLDHLRGPGLGQLPELFDAEPPYRPRGCPAQAWSVAEVLRAYHRATVKTRGTPSHK